MKTPYAIGLAIVSVLIAVAIEESRIASLRSTLKMEALSAAKPAPAVASNGNGEAKDPSVRTKSHSEVKPGPALKAGDSEDESFAKAARKMWDNPAGKAMMNSGTKMAVAMMYQDFIDKLKMTKEEGEYFKNLLGKGMADQQELGMKMLGASPDEQKALVDEITKRSGENDAEIKKFLNSDEDFKSFSDYKNRLPEHQELDGIRTVMADKGAPLAPETETRLADAMYRARTQSNAPDMSGPAAMDQLAKGNMEETFVKNWEKQQETLRVEVSGILNETQMAAFQDYQQQMKEMQLMGIKMAAKMMPTKK
jgi:hypothetical protein